MSGVEIPDVNTARCITMGCPASDRLPANGKPLQCTTGKHLARIRNAEKIFHYAWMNTTFSSAGVSRFVTARRYALCGICYAPVFPCPSVQPSQIFILSKRLNIIVTQIPPHDSLGTWFFWCQRSYRNSNGITLIGDTSTCTCKKR